jgi:hypothetical protein
MTSKRARDLCRLIAYHMRVAGVLATHDRLSQAELDHVIAHG